MSSPSLTLPRSFLYVPGHRTDLIQKASSGNADAIILDLEDSVPRPTFRHALKNVTDFLSTTNATGPEKWVRLATSDIDESRRLFDTSQLAGIVLAKCELTSAEKLSMMISQFSVNPPVIGLIESATCLRDIHLIAASGFIQGFGIGLVDLLADMRVQRSATNTVDGIFLNVVTASAAAGLAAPVAPTSVDFRNLEAFAVSTAQAYAQGFRSRTAIHPSQVPVIHKVFTPSESEVSEARELIRLFNASNMGVTVDKYGRMVDVAVVRSAFEILSRASSNEKQA